MLTTLYPSHFSLEYAIRPNVLALQKYVTSTSDEAQARSIICLDANENSAGCCLAPRKALPTFRRGPFELGNLNRYPSASQKTLRQCIAQWRQLESPEHLCLGSGASDIIDLIIRVTCTPSRDKILITPPTFELYRVCATLHDVDIQECSQELVAAEEDFRLPIDEICRTLSSDTQIKVVFLISPGNPSGSLIPLAEIKRILDLKAFRGIVVVDEAYIDFAAFSKRASAVNLISAYNNLVIVQSLSKSHGLAGLRVGMAIAHPVIISILNKVQMPYRLSSVTLSLACRALSPKRCHRQRVRRLQCEVMANRAVLLRALAQPPLVRGGVGRPVGGNAANFVLIPILSAPVVQGSPGKRDDRRAIKIMERLKAAHGIAVRYVGKLPLCQGCLRITVGTAKEIDLLIKAFKQVVDEC